MRKSTDLMDPRDAQEAMQAFAQPATGQEVAPYGGGQLPAGGMTITDGVITAQKVEVERDERKVLQKLSTLAAVAGEDWFYRFPVKKKGGGQDFIEGPSIKCANNVARSYGNCQVDTRVVDAGATWVIYARFVDYETGFSLTRPFQQDKNASRMGGADDARRRDIALQIGVSKAIRNVICNALETFTTFAFEEAQKNLVGRIGKDLARYKERVAERLKAMGVDSKRVEAMLGRTTDAWLAPDVARVIAEIKAVTDGMATADETWPPPAPPEPKRGDFKAETAPVAGQPHEPGADKGQAVTSPTAAGGDSQPEAAGQPDAARPWKMQDDIMGQDARMQFIRAQFMDQAETPAEVDAIKAEHAAFIAKLGSRRSAFEKEMADRWLILGGEQ